MFANNIKNFDLPIVNRLNKEYKVKKKHVFNPRDQFDLIDTVNLWFEGNDDLPNYQLKTVRKYLGLSQEGAQFLKANMCFPLDG